MKRRIDLDWDILGKNVVQWSDSSVIVLKSKMCLGQEKLLFVYILIFGCTTCTHLNEPRWRWDIPSITITWFYDLKTTHDLENVWDISPMQSLPWEISTIGKEIDLGWSLTKSVFCGGGRYQQGIDNETLSTFLCSWQLYYFGGVGRFGNRPEWWFWQLDAVGEHGLVISWFSHQISMCHWKHYHQEI